MIQIIFKEHFKAHNYSFQSFNDKSLSNHIKELLKRMSVTTSETSTNIQLHVLQVAGYSFPPQSIIKIDHVNGMKEGIGTVISTNKIVLAKMNFHNDILNGLSIFFDSEGRKEKEMFYKNDSHFNWGREFKNDRVVFEGFYLDGKRYSELRQRSGNESIFEELIEGKIVSISKYNDDHEKIGKGQSFEYVGNDLKEVFDIENGEKSVKRIEFDNQQMKELNDNGCIIYEGGFRGNPREGFKRNGEGDEFDDNGLLVYSGHWKDDERNGNGLVYDNGVLMFEGEWIEGKPYGNGKLYNNDGEVIMERMWRNEYDDLSNGIFRISDDCYIEIVNNEVFVNEWKPGVLFECSSRWRKHSFNKLNENDKNDLMKRNSYIGINDKPVEMNRTNERSIEVLRNEREPLERVIKHTTGNNNRLMIKRINDLRELLINEERKKGVSELVINEECGNEMKGNLELCGFENLENLVVKKNSLMNLNSLKISDNPVLKSIDIEDGDYRNDGLKNVKNVMITSLMIYD